MVILSAIVIILLLMFLMAEVILNKAFGKRCEPNPRLKYYTKDDFEELDAEAIEFKSNKGQILRGNVYFNKNIKDYKGIIVFVHGMGGGHLSYTTEINTFAKAGFMVLGYDCTGTFASEGKNLKGFFQHVIDLKYALEYVNEKYNNYDVYLVGHSWGAYSVCQILQYNPNVKAVVAMSGFNNSSKILCDSAKTETKIDFTIFKPFFTIINFVLFGIRGIKNTVDILKNTNVPVLILHGDVDTSVSIENSLVFDYNKDNIKVIVYENRYHNVYQTKESEKYLNDTFGNISNIGKKYRGKIPEEECKKLYDSIDFKKMTEEDNDVMNTIIKFLLDKDI